MKKILVIGNDQNLAEFKSKFTANHDYEFCEGYLMKNDLEDYDLVFDFLIGDNPEQFEIYAEVSGLPVFVNAPKISLGELAFYQAEVNCLLFGFNGMPDFLDRPLLEVSSLSSENEDLLRQICAELETDLEIVNDRVGMVTPRILCMIINEAFYTLQEGTATIEDIDQGMKLGTNYPFGPFEWCDRIGLQHVYELLEAIYEDTKEERYKICPLLKQNYLRLK
ncbi:MAG: 3-hydroxyacyl-CoA dehydrogenase [Roseivirga sp.]|nr:3-hydroxyacyl-CoA dehydrogenase [Roseivirga sp.]